MIELGGTAKRKCTHHCCHVAAHAAFPILTSSYAQAALCCPFTRQRCAEECTHHCCHVAAHATFPILTSSYAQAALCCPFTRQRCAEKCTHPCGHVAAHAVLHTLTLAGLCCMLLRQQWVIYERCTHHCGHIAAHVEVLHHRLGCEVEVCEGIQLANQRLFAHTDTHRRYV